MTIYTCGRLDAYDNLNGSILLAWGPFLNGTPDSFNIYVNGTLYVNIPGAILGNLELTSGLGNLQLLSGGRLQLLIQTSALNAYFATVSGLTQTTYSSSAVASVSGNSLRPQNMPPNGVVSNSGTYIFWVTAVSGGVEVTKSAARRVTVSPTSIMLTTPMKRIYPFPQTGID